MCHGGILIPRVGSGASSEPTVASGKLLESTEKEQKVDWVSWVSTQLTSFRLELARIKPKNSVRDRSGQEVRESGACSWGRVHLMGLWLKLCREAPTLSKRNLSFGVLVFRTFTSSSQKAGYNSDPTIA